MGCVNSKRAISNTVGDESPVLNYPSSSSAVAVAAAANDNSHYALSFVDPSSRGSSRNPSGLLLPPPANELKHRSSRSGSGNGSGRIRKVADLLDTSGNIKEEEEEKVVGEIQNQINHTHINDNAVDSPANEKKKKKKLERRASLLEIGSISVKPDVVLPLPRRRVGAEQIAAGWPSWLSAAAGEAINGWIPFQADAYEKLEKVGQGTYSSVFRAREVETGRMVALKKVRFDNFQPESIRFMAREILILRRLDHPNIMKLDGIITSRLSSSIYLVFEYMEHDLAGLSSSPDINLTQPQVKCYMKQLLRAIEHCHLRGVMHRDIKMSNILVNNQGVLKLGDFGLANVLVSKGKQRLTSRVVTLWYRPPELLLGSTSYGVSVDLWSVGCVFAELLIGKPLLKGRTEVEQLHKIFKLCGSPPDEFWKQYNLPNATMFRPQHPYESSVRDRCKDFPPAATELIETLLSIHPEKRGSASSALLSRYINSKPYACDPSTLPIYPPNKEMDAKCREDTRRKRSGMKARELGVKRTKGTMRGNSFNKIGLKENNTTSLGAKVNESSQAAIQVPKDDQGYTVPAPAITASSGFAWTKQRKDDLLTTLSYDSNGSQVSGLDAPFKFPSLNEGKHSDRKHKDKILQHQQDPPPPDSLKAFLSYVIADDIPISNSRQEFIDQSHKVEFSGPLLSQSNKVAQSNQIGVLLQKNENQIRRAARRSRLDRGNGY
ncbi:Cyclin-dependent kinase C-2 C [Linum perenne]